MRASPLLRVWAVAASAIAGALLVASPTRAANVTWTFTNNVTGCPAGDSVVAGHPGKIRVRVQYTNSLGQFKNGVPPESIWVTTSTASGNAVVQSQPKAFADDTTKNLGETWVTIPSLSGCGALNLNLYVSGVLKLTGSITVRTVDSNADGIVTTADQVGACDLNYNGFVGDATDTALVGAHLDHWFRNMLLGTLVRRTNLCETCREETTNTLGESLVSWSPDGKSLAFTIHAGAWVPADNAAPCVAFMVKSDPKDGDALTRLTFPPGSYHDYDPQWSPTGDFIVFDRHDRYIIKKGIPGIAADTNEVILSQAGNASISGDVTPGISADGQWVAFSRRDTVGPTTGARHIWKVPIGGGTPMQLTFESDGVDFYPQWSTNGNWIYFDRQSGPSTNPHTVGRVKFNGDSLQTFFAPPAGQDAATPGTVPDDAVVLFGQGTHDTGPDPPQDVTTRTLGLNSTLKRAVGYYNQTIFAAEGPDPVLSPRISPDGTRTTLHSKQIWAARRNMNLPPSLNTLNGTSVVHATPVLAFNAPATAALSIVAAASDPEADAITYAAYFPDTLGISFNPGTHTLSWTPTYGQIGRVAWVRFQVTTPTGGADYALAKITVTTPVDLVLQNFSWSSTQLYEATNSIIALNDTVQATGNVTLHVTDAAGTGIVLQPGFWAKSGGTFRAYIADGSALIAKNEPPETDAPPPGSDSTAAGGSPPPVAVESLVDALGRGVPNPTVGATTIHFSLASEKPVRIQIFDLQGRLVRTLVDGTLSPGAHVATWDGRGFDGTRIEPGVFLYRMRAGGFHAARKLVLAP